MRIQNQSEKLYALCAEAWRFAPGARFHTVRHIIDNFNAGRRTVDAVLDRMERRRTVVIGARGLFIGYNYFVRGRTKITFPSFHSRWRFSANLLVA